MRAACRPAGAGACNLLALEDLDQARGAVHAELEGFQGANAMASLREGDKTRNDASGQDGGKV